MPQFTTCQEHFSHTPRFPRPAKNSTYSLPPLSLPYSIAPTHTYTRLHAFLILDFRKKEYVTVRKSATSHSALCGDVNASHPCYVTLDEPVEETDYKTEESELK